MYWVFLGLVSHFLVECPSWPITTFNDINNNGAICMPFYGYNDYAIKPTIIWKMG